MVVFRLLFGRFVVIIYVKHTEHIIVNCELRNKKMRYIPLCAAGELSIRKAAKLIGITPESVFRLKHRYLKDGNAIFIHGNTGRTPKNKKYNKSDIVKFYEDSFSYAPFAVVADYYPAGASYSTVYNALTAAGKMSPRAHKPVREKKKHMPRPERPNAGDLVQLDGSRHDWFMNGKKATLHGAIDDATHKIVGLYFCENECLLGYYQLLHQIKNKCGGLPRAFYSDRSSCFFVTKQNLEKVSIQEQLAGSSQAQTQWQRVCKELNIELIAAYSPQAKGRIERLWGTLQGRLPYIFRFMGIDNITDANKFLDKYINNFNEQFGIPAQDPAKHWQKPPLKDYDYLFSVRAEKKTRSDGSFIYHGYKFGLVSPRSACVNFTLCLSENYGLRAYMDGKYYEVELREPLCDVYGDAMPNVEKDLIYRYFLTDTHGSRIKIS